MPKSSLELFQKIFIDEFTREFQLYIEAGSDRGELHADFTDKLLALFGEPILGLIDNIPIPGADLIHTGASFFIDWLNEKRKEGKHNQGEKLAVSSEPDRLRILLENVAMEAACRYQYWITACLVAEPLEGIVPFVKTGVERALEYVIRNKLPLTQQNLLTGFFEGRSGAYVSGYRDTALSVVDEPSQSFQARAKRLLTMDRTTAEAAYKRPGLQTFDGRLWVLKDKNKSAEQSAYKKQKAEKSTKRREGDILFDGGSTKFSVKEDPKYGHMLVSTMFRNARYGHLDERETLQDRRKLTTTLQQKLAGYRPIWITITHKELVDYLNQDPNVNGGLSLLDYCRNLSTSNSEVERVFYCADSSLDELNLTSLNFAGRDLSHTVFNNCQFGGSLVGSIWNQSYLREADFSQVISAEGADFSNAHLEGLNASGINFSTCNFTQTQFHFANLSNANLHGTKTLGAVWSHTNLADAQTSDWDELKLAQKEQQALAIQQAESLREISLAFNHQQQQIMALRNDLQRLDEQSSRKPSGSPATSRYDHQAKLHKLDEFTTTLLHEQQARLSLERHCEMELRRLSYHAAASLQVEQSHTEQIAELQLNLTKLQDEQQHFMQLVEDTHRLSEQVWSHDVKIGALGKHLDELESRFEGRLVTLEAQVLTLDTRIDDVIKTIKIETLPALVKQLQLEADHFFLVIDLPQLANFNIPLTAQPSRQDVSNPEDLMAMVDQFIFNQEKAKERVCLLLGDAGSGKTIFGLLLQKRLWERNDSLSPSDRQIIPIRIEMKRFNQEGAQDCINTVLKKDYNLTDSAIRTLKASTAQFVFIFDGYDEIAGGGMINPYQANQLGQWGINPKIVISCRSQYLHDQPYKALLGPGGENNDAQVVEWHIQPFNTNQIHNYFSMRAAENDLDGRSPDEYVSFLTKTPGLVGLINTPFLLKIFISAYPVLLKHPRKIARSDLYDAFTHAWFKKEEQTLIEQSMANHGHVGGDSQKSFLRFSRLLAFAMFEERVNEVSYQVQSDNPWADDNALDDLTSPHHPLNKSNSQKWELFFSDKTEATIQARRGCPLRCLDGTTYSFVHQSFLEYFVADGLWEVLVNQKNQEQQRAKWGARCLTNEPKMPAVIQFLADRLRTDPHRKIAEDNLYALVAASKKCATTALSDTQKNCAIRAASNAMTVLNFGLIAFTIKALENKTFFQGIQICDADLTSAELCGVDLSDSDLSGVDFTGAKLNYSIFDDSNLTGINLKEFPMLPEDNPIQCVAYSSNGRWLVSANDNVIKLYKQSKLHWKPQATLIGHEDQITSITFSPTNNQFASGSRDKTIRLWDIVDSEEDIYITPGPVFLGHENWVTGVTYSTDARQIASSSSDNTIRLWTIKTQSALVFYGHTDRVTSVSFSHKSNRLVSGSADKTLRVWRDDGTCEFELSGHNNWVTAVKFSPDDTLIASTSIDQTVRLWVASTGTPKSILKGHTETINAIDFSPSGYQFATASADNTIRLWGVNGTTGPLFEGHTEEVTDIAYSPDGTQLISVSSDCTLRIWGVHSALAPPQEGHANAVSGIALSKVGDQFASASADHSVMLWTTNGTAVRVFDGHKDEVISIAFSHDNHIISTSKDQEIRFWHTDGTEGPVVKHTSAVRSIACDPNSNQFISSSDDPSIALWSPTKHDSTATYARISEEKFGVEPTGLTSEQITCIAYSPDGSQLALGTNNKTVRLLSKEGKPGYILAQHTKPVSCLAFSLDGLQLISGSYDKTIRLWQTTDGSFRRVFKGHTGAVLTVAISPNGLIIASGGADNTIRLWDANSLRGPILLGHKKGISSIVFSSDNQLISASLDKTIRIWRRSENGIWLQMCQHPRDTTLSAMGSSMRNVVGISPLNFEYFRQSQAICTVKPTHEIPNDMQIVTPARPKFNLNRGSKVSIESLSIPKSSRAPSTHTLSNGQANLSFFKPARSGSYSLEEIEATEAPLAEDNKPMAEKNEQKSKHSCCSLM